MCGIVGYVGSGSALPVVLDGLKRLEYRGYDSAGVAWSSGDALERLRSPGRVADLESLLGDPEATPDIHCAIGHTRWATHGPPNEANCHPHGDRDGNQPCRRL